MTVYATARRVSDLAELATAGCNALALDVTDEVSMVAAVRTIEAEHGAVDVLVNNAGYSQSGAFETVPIARVRKQFETNVFGLVRLSQLVLPAMRKRGWGRIVNLSSMGGRLVFPGGAFYHATKYAVEALSDAMRFELRPFGIDVVIIEPGLIKSRFGETGASGIADMEATSDDATRTYAEFNAAVAKATQEVYEQGPLAKLSGVPEDVARTIANAIAARRPKARYTVSWSAKVLLAQRRILNDRLWDWFLRQNFPSPSTHALASKSGAAS